MVKFKADSEVTSLHGQPRIGESAVDNGNGSKKCVGCASDTINDTLNPRVADAVLEWVSHGTCHAKNYSDLNSAKLNRKDCRRF